ncbi:MAG: hypothetical protein NTW38_00120 [Candidatus Aminicenantes bacterium]|nr:hypothetical protein [Candidatus Aminicenantes bacterium]
MNVENRVCFFILVGVLAAAALPLRGQFTPAEIERRAEHEEFLRTAKIVRSEPVGEGVTAPWKLYLQKDGLEHKAVWKNVTTEPGGRPDEWRYEIAAYRLDKLLGLNMIPPAVERKFLGKPGALSYWAENRYSLLKIQESAGAIQIPAASLEQTDKMKYVCRLWDSLIGNDDRTQQNILFTEDWRVILIDHSRAFRADGEYGKRLIYGVRGIKMMAAGPGGQRPVLFRRIPRAFLDRLKTLDAAAVQAAVGPYLTKREIKAVLVRKDLILTEVEEMIARDGEDKVLY